MQQEFENLNVELSGGVACCAINRPRVMNALSSGVLNELGTFFSEVAGDEEVGAVVLTGAETGKKPAFAAGADIAEMAEMSGLELRRHARLGQATLGAIARCPKPVLAAVNGFALGGGLELAMACHMRWAAEGARLGQPEINLGIIPGFGGTQRLVRLVGTGRALEMLLGGDPIEAEEALRIGLVDRVLPDDDLLPRALEFAGTLASKAPVARALIIDAVGRGADAPLAEALDIEADLFGIAGSTADTKEGLRAFLEKRTPHFVGR